MALKSMNWNSRGKVPAILFYACVARNANDALMLKSVVSTKVICNIVLKF